MTDKERILVLWGLSLNPSASAVTTNEIITQSRNHSRQKNSQFCLITLPSTISVKKIVGNSTSVCLLTQCGALYSWGNHSGHGVSSPAAPLRLESLSSHFIRGLAAGNSHYLCATENGIVYSWGRGSHCLGHGAGVANLPFPTEIQSLHGEEVVDVAATNGNSFAMTKSRCYAWGSTGSLLGTGSPDNIGSAIPQICPSLQGVMKSIYCGTGHVGLLIDEKVFMWGSNSKGECHPNSDQNPIAVPRELEPLGEGRSFLMLALGNEFTLALSSDGKVYGWGSNAHGQLGTGNTKPTSPRTLISAIASRNIIEVFAGGNTAGCRTDENLLFTWGLNDSGQLGHVDTQNWTIPRCIDSSAILNDSDIAPKAFHLSKFSNLSGLVFESYETSLESDSQEILLEDIERLFNDERISDIVINVDKRKIYVSKFILYARSEYFRALISSEMKESKDGEIHIEEFSYDAMLETMRYLYTGRCEFTPQIALQILEIGLKYLLPDLVARAENYLETEFTYESVFPILIEADRLSAASIRDRAIWFILSHWNTLARSSGIATLPPHLLLDLVRLSSTHRGGDDESTDD